MSRGVGRSGGRACVRAVPLVEAQTRASAWQRGRGGQCGRAWERGEEPMPLVEVARRLGVSKATVEKHHVRAIAKLRAGLLEVMIERARAGEATAYEWAVLEREAAGMAGMAGRQGGKA